MTELQSKLLDMLAWFNAFCQENGLNYYLVGGTMLGAVRHGGFIPWDDDIDLGMPREDYKKLAQILGTGENAKYVLETPDSKAKDFNYPCAKLYDTTTTLIENTKYQTKRGIYLDIFPIDGIGDTLEEAKRNYRKINRYHSLLLTRVTGIRKGRSALKNAAVIAMRILPDWILSGKKILKKIAKLCEKRNFYGCEYVGNLIGAWHERELMPRSVFGTPQKIKFETIEAFGVEQPDEYLTHLYGNWRQLPPVEKQVSHHDYILLDLNKPYMDNEAV